MNNVFVIGNSHTACLKQAWDNVAVQYPDNTLVFFAHRGKKIADLEIDGDALIATNKSLESALEFTSGGLRQIRPDDADLILLHGLGLKVPHDPKVFYSQKVRERALLDRIETTRSFDLLQKIRTISNVPVYLNHDPLPARTAATPNGTTDAYYANIDMLNSIVFEKLHAQVLYQPADTLADSYSTLSAYSKGSSRLSIGHDNDNERHPEIDVYHMNADFGALVLRSLLSSPIPARVADDGEV
jgi:hypothetical protein